MAVKFKIKTGDFVKVHSGSDKGKVGVVKSVDRKSFKVTVEGVGACVKHRKPTQFSAGGKEIIYKPVHISNVALYDEKTQAHSKVGYKVLDDGTKTRFLKKTGAAV